MKKFFAFTIFLFSLFLVSSLHAQDASEGYTLEEIDAEILDTNYNHALLMLNSFIKQFPEKFDSAQKRIKKIIQAREEYASLSKELINVIVEEPENNEKKLDIIARLEALEKHPTSEALAFIAQAKSAAQFTYYRAVFNRLMGEGSEFVASKKYTSAVNKFREGFSLYQSDFFDSVSDSELSEPVKNALSSIDGILPEFVTIQKSLNDACEAFIRAVKSGNYTESVSTFAVVQNQFTHFARIRNTITFSGQTFDSIFAKMKEIDPTLTDSSFLPFVSRFTFGRGSDPDTGILGAMDAQWNTLVERMKNEVYVEIVDQTKEVEKEINGEKIFTVFRSPSTNQLVSIQNFSTLGSSVNNLYSLRANRSGSIDSDYCPQYDASMKFIAQLSNNLVTQLDTINNFRTEVDKNNAYKMPENAVTSIRSGQDFAIIQRTESVSVFEKIKTDSKNLASSDWFLQYLASSKDESPGVNAETLATENPEEEQKNTPERTTPGILITDNVLEWKTAQDIFAFLCNESASRADAEAVKQWVTISAHFARAGDSIATEYEGQFAWAQNLLASSTDSRTSPDGTVFVAGAYPVQSLALVQNLQRDLPQDRVRLTDAQKLLPTNVEYANSISENRQILNKSIERLDALNLSGQRIVSQANERILLATRAENEAELRFSQAQQALNRDNFNGAREYLQRARSKYNESLTYQTSATLLETSDAKLILLGEQITARENVIVVADVRRLKNDARNAYYSGDFEEAENLLTRAKTRWATTNVEEDVEITNLMSMVVTALSMQTGRVILPTAPLYPEMSQILSIANQYYDEGQKLMKKGQKTEATDILQQAKAKLRELQLVYPLNQEASLLTLRIDKLIDSESFDAMFKRRVDNARSDYRNADKRQSAYTDLLDLYTINPGYPGLSTLIYNVEIEIGIRQKPVDKSSLRRSDTLTADAQKIVNSSRNEIELRRALSLVDEAISLNPQNQTASVLKDRIQISIGGKATVVLSAADEMRYQQAIQELQNNNIIGAYALVQQLLQSPANSRSAKVLDLQRKVQALL